MADRPYLTSAEAATYCGFKTIGGIQQAVRRGKLKPAGRRGGTGTYVFAIEDLDAFLTGGLQPHERLFVAPAPPEAGEALPSPRRSATAAPARPPSKSSPGQPRTAPHPLPKQPPGAPRGRKPAESDDPVARIVRALSGSAASAANDLHKNAKRTSGR